MTSPVVGSCWAFPIPGQSRRLHSRGRRRVHSRVGLGWLPLLAGRTDSNKHASHGKPNRECNREYRDMKQNTIPHRIDLRGMIHLPFVDLSAPKLFCCVLRHRYLFHTVCLFFPLTIY